MARRTLTEINDALEGACGRLPSRHKDAKEREWYLFSGNCEIRHPRHFVDIHNLVYRSMMVRDECLVPARIIV